MRRCLSFAVAMLLVALDARAQQPFYGRLGIFDDPAHTLDFGTMDPGFKSIYAAPDLDDLPWGPYLDGIEFSIAGLESFVLGSVVITPPPSVTFGDVRAPADSLTGQGGIAIAWPSFVPDSLISMAIGITHGSPPVDHVFRVLRRFPSHSPNWQYPLGFFDAGPAFLRMPLVGGTYTLNPTVAVESRTWSVVKSLYQRR
jgi:hypothetical protein